MLNYIWGFMILAGIIYACFSGNMAAVGNGILDSAKEAVSLCITLLGVMALWTGIMEIADRAGIVSSATTKLRPVLKKLFPGLPSEHKVNEYISMNIIANILGLGWAATPSGLMAMKELSILNAKSEIASNYMCTFLIINISSLQLIPVNIIAYRSQYGSVNPALIIGPVLVATAVSTLAAIIFCGIMNRIKKSR